MTSFEVVTWCRCWWEDQTKDTWWSYGVDWKYGSQWPCHPLWLSLHAYKEEPSWDHITRHIISPKQAPSQANRDPYRDTEQASSTVASSVTCPFFSHVHWAMQHLWQGPWVRHVHGPRRCIQRSQLYDQSTPSRVSSKSTSWIQSKGKFLSRPRLEVPPRE